jgi:hypothetical protein
MQDHVQREREPQKASAAAGTIPRTRDEANSKKLLPSVSGTTARPLLITSDSP